MGWGVCMVTALSILSTVCVVCIFAYLTSTVISAVWVSIRHGGRYFHLEFQPHRARGSKEAARAKLLRRFRLFAVLAFPIGAASFLASAILSELK